MTAPVDARHSAYLLRWLADERRRALEVPPALAELAPSPEAPAPAVARVDEEALVDAAASMVAAIRWVAAEERDSIAAVAGAGADAVRGAVDELDSGRTDFLELVAEHRAALDRLSTQGAGQLDARATVETQRLEEAAAAQERALLELTAQRARELEDLATAAADRVDLAVLQLADAATGGLSELDAATARSSLRIDDLAVLHGAELETAAADAARRLDELANQRQRELDADAGRRTAELAAFAGEIAALRGTVERLANDSLARLSDLDARIRDRSAATETLMSNLELATAAAAERGAELDARARAAMDAADARLAEIDTRATARADELDAKVDEARLRMETLLDARLDAATATSLGRLEGASTASTERLEHTIVAAADALAAAVGEWTSELGEGSAAMRAELEELRAGIVRTVNESATADGEVLERVARNWIAQIEQMGRRRRDAARRRKLAPPAVALLLALAGGGGAAALLGREEVMGADRRVAAATLDEPVVDPPADVAATPVLGPPGELPTERVDDAPLSWTAPDVAVTTPRAAAASAVAYVAPPTTTPAVPLDLVATVNALLPAQLQALLDSLR